MNIGLDGLKISERDTVGCRSIGMIESETKHENTNKTKTVQIQN